MVDTITFQLHFDYETNQKVQNKIELGIIPLIKKRYLNGKRVYGRYVGSSPPFDGLYYNARTGYLLIKISIMLLLGHRPTKNDVTTIEEKVISFFENTFDLSINNVDNFGLNRIDYKMDFKCTKSIETDIFYDLRKIATDKLNDVIKSTRESSITYHPKNGYIELISYDKEKELLQKMKKKEFNEIFAENESFDDYIGVIRTEVRIQNRKLNYFKKKWGLSKELSNYLDDSMAEYFFEKYAEKVWYREPFYRIDIALKKINNSKELKLKMREKLCSLILLIHKNGLTEAQKYYDKNFSSETFKNHIKRIRRLGINPLTFSSKYPIIKMENFAKRDNEDK